MKYKIVLLLFCMPLVAQSKTKHPAILQDKGRDLSDFCIKQFLFFSEYKQPFSLPDFYNQPVKNDIEHIILYPQHYLTWKYIGQVDKQHHVILAELINHTHTTLFIIKRIQDNLYTTDTFETDSHYSMTDAQIANNFIVFDQCTTDQVLLDEIVKQLQQIS